MEKSTIGKNDLTGTRRQMKQNCRNRQRKSTKHQLFKKQSLALASLKWPILLSILLRALDNVNGKCTAFIF